MKVLARRLLGLLLFGIFNRLEFRYLFPVRVIVDFVESARLFSLKLMGSRVGNESFVRSGLFLTNPRNLIIGEHSKLGPNAEVWNYSELAIGDNVEIGSRFVVHTDEHIVADTTLPLTKQGSLLSSVNIMDDVYIGSCVTVLSGVTIESRVIVAAGSVVTKNLKSGFLYGGVPAKVIKALPTE